MNNKLTNPQVGRNRYNPEYFHNQSIELRESVSSEEALAWYNHPCTQALRSALEGDLAGFVVMWLGAGYHDEENAQNSLQKLTKAMGQAQVVQDVILAIEEIRDCKSEGENY